MRFTNWQLSLVGFLPQLPQVLKQRRTGGGGAITPSA